MIQLNKNAEVIRVFVASTPSEWLPLKVLEFSIREQTKHAVDVRGLYTFERDYALPYALENRPRTPFSFQRFLIPEFCAFNGRAIYLDSDMQVFEDIHKLWSFPFDNFDLLTVQQSSEERIGQFSVMLLNCERLPWKIEEIVNQLNQGELTYQSLMYEMKVAENVGAVIPPIWNALEKFEPSKTALLHYTDMNTQPWVSTENPLGVLWVSCLRRAIETGFISYADVEREVKLGHVRPSLLPQLELEQDDSLSLTKQVRELDSAFVPPYKKLQSLSGKPWTSLLSYIRIWISKLYYKTVIPRLLRNWFSS